MYLDKTYFNFSQYLTLFDMLINNKQILNYIKYELFVY